MPWGSFSSVLVGGSSSCNDSRELHSCKWNGIVSVRANVWMDGMKSWQKKIGQGPRTRTRHWWRGRCSPRSQLLRDTYMTIHGLHIGLGAYKHRRYYLKPLLRNQFDGRKYRTQHHDWPLRPCAWAKVYHRNVPARWTYQHQYASTHVKTFPTL